MLILYLNPIDVTTVVDKKYLYALKKGKVLAFCNYFLHQGIVQISKL